MESLRIQSKTYKWHKATVFALLCTLSFDIKSFSNALTRHHILNSLIACRSPHAQYTYPIKNS